MTRPSGESSSPPPPLETRLDRLVSANVSELRAEAVDLPSHLDEPLLLGVPSRQSRLHLLRAVCRREVFV